MSLSLLAGCGAGTPGPAGPEPPAENNVGFFAMDTYMTVRAYGADDALLETVEEFVEGLEAELSTTLETSAVCAANHTGAAALSEEAAYVLGRALDMCGETGGALDISIYPVVRAWGFTTDGDYRVPPQAELDALLEAVDYTRVSFDGARVSLPEGVEIDLGSVVKGYAGDRVCDILRAGGVESALLDLGGNVQALGAKPDGSGWRVAIRDPRDGGYIGVVSVSDRAVVTSGGYERYFIDDDGRLWWHIIDPADGYPARSGLISVTAVGSEGLYCDALSTSLFIMGMDGAVEFWRRHGDFDMILVTEDGRAVLTPGLADIFTPTEGSAYTYAFIGDESDG